MEKLHQESFVYDFSPHGEPIPLTERTVAAMQESIAAGSLPAALRRIWSEHLSELEDDAGERERVAAEWRRSGVNAIQVTLGGMELDTHDWDASVRDAARWHRRAAIGDQMTICTSADDLRRAHAEDRVGVVLGLQDTLPIGTDLSRLEVLYGLGVRVIQLTYNRRNLVGDGCTERHQSGLSRFGVDLVRELNRLGIVVDVSHCGVGTTNEAIEVSEAPLAFTHTACRALYDHPRAKSDEQLALLAEGDGYVGIVAVPSFLGANGAGTAQLADQVAHAAEIVGIERVGIGTDWGFWTLDFPVELRDLALRAFQATSGFRPDDLELGVALEGFESWGDWPVITRGLAERGFSDEEIRGILGGNWLRFLERVQK
jgi:membrane dipeptidase